MALVSEEQGKAFAIAVQQGGTEEADIFQAQEGEILHTTGTREEKLSARNIGLQAFRFGAEYRVTTANGEPRTMLFPGFGEKFHTIQLEIDREIRDDPEQLRILKESLIKIVKEFPQTFT